MDQPVTYGGTVYGNSATEKTSLTSNTSTTNPPITTAYPPPPDSGYAPQDTNPYPPPSQVTSSTPYPPTGNTTLYQAPPPSPTAPNYPQNGGSLYQPPPTTPYQPSQTLPGGGNPSYHQGGMEGNMYQGMGGTPSYQGGMGGGGEPYQGAQLGGPVAPLGVPYPSQPVAGSTVVVVGGAAPSVRVNIDYGFGRMMSSPVVERGYPIQLTGIVSEREHGEVVGKLNEYLEEKWSTVNFWKFVAFISLLGLMLLPLGLVFADAFVVFAMAVSVSGILFAFSVVWMRKQQRIVYSDANAHLAVLSERFQSKGIQYKLEYEVQLVRRNKKEYVYFLQINFAPGAGATAQAPTQ